MGKVCTISWHAHVTAYLRAVRRGVHAGQDVGDDEGGLGQAPGALAQEGRHVVRGRDQRVAQLQSHALCGVDAQARHVQRPLHRPLRAPEVPSMRFHNHPQPCRRSHVTLLWPCLAAADKVSTEEKLTCPAAATVTCMLLKPAECRQPGHFTHQADCMHIT